MERAAAEIAHDVSVEPTGSALPEQDRNRYVALEMVKVVPESDIITSFYLRRADGQPLYPWEPGQFLPIRVTIPGQDTPAMRTYTLSTASNPDHYRLSVRRADGKALVSPFLHANGKPGLRIEAMAPRGRFTLTRSANRPVVLLSAGVGITPMMAMSEHIVAEGKRTGTFRPVHFIHGAQNGKLQAFGHRLAEMAGEHPSFKLHVVYSAPGTDDALGTGYHSEGHIDLDLIKRILPFADYEFYLCGPAAFMKSLYDGLTGHGRAGGPHLL